MVFSYPSFLFAFLPLTLAFYAVAPARLRNFFLFLVSLLFYSWAGISSTPILLASILWNWFFGQLLAKKDEHERAFLAVGVGGNLLLLFYFKYAAFLAANLNQAYAQFAKTELFTEPTILLPVGISFFTFHAISYLVDISRGQARAIRNPVNLGLYFAFFPQLIAGPIVRYREIASQLERRAVSLPSFTAGCERFILGLGKKVLLADPLAQPASHVFSLSAAQLTAPTAWFGLLCFTLQIYFDFSGYSDMAIGLARMFGFEFPENFRHPYAATSLRDFWRRWHLTLSNWFRDYLYIPLGGGRGSSLVTHRNLLCVFLLCGLWHGATWNFALWGLFHGALLVLERGRWGAALAKLPSPLARAYTLLTVMLSWVLFRATGLDGIAIFFRALFGLSIGSTYGNGVAAYYNPHVFVCLAAGALLSFPMPTLFFRGRRYWRVPALAGIFVLSVAYVGSENIRPFLYFQF